MDQKRKTALIVDDEALVRETLAAQLDMLGYECVAVSNGPEALNRAASQEFALLLLDAMMPGMSGVDVLRRFRGDHLETCIVMLTGRAETAFAVECLELGADDYITKPCLLEDLRTRLAAAGKRRELATTGTSRQPPDEQRIDPLEVTEDLVNQQISLYDKLTSRGKRESVEPKRRRWWPWT